MKLPHITCLSLALLLTACGGSSDDADKADFELRDNTQEVQAYYAEHPDFFGFKTLADLPVDLTWQNGELERIQGSEIALRFTARRARFYSYWIE